MVRRFRFLRTAAVGLSAWRIITNIVCHSGLAWTSPWRVLRRSVASEASAAGRAVIFDCDGTLLDTETVYKDAFNQVLSECYKGPGKVEPVNATAWGLDYVGKGNGSAIAVSRFGLSCAPEEFDALWTQRFTELMHLPGSIPLLPGFDELYTEARAKGFKIAVASSSDGPILRQKLVAGVIAQSEAVSTLHDFDVILSNDDVNEHKPHPEIYLLAARRLGVDPHLCFVVEDSATGILAGSRAGMHAIAVPNQYTVTHDFSEAEVVAHSMLDVIELL